MERIIYSILVIGSLIACQPGSPNSDRSVPVEIVDLGTLVTEDLPEKVWGKEFMNRYGFSENNTFRVINWNYEFPDGLVSGSNSYFTLFNHGGPHVDAPNHIGFERGIDSYSIDSFVGPLKIIDVSRFGPGRTVTKAEILSHNIEAGDIVLIYTAYQPPQGEKVWDRVTLTPEAARYLAELPVRAFGTDSFNVESDEQPAPGNAASALERIAPNHMIFLSRGIPLYEQLFNLEQLLDRKRMLFVGVPLNIKNGDGMMVRPVVLVYK